MLATLLVAFVVLTADDASPEQPRVIQSDAPAENLADAFCVGRGRLTAAVYGGIGTEKISFFGLNESTRDAEALEHCSGSIREDAGEQAEASGSRARKDETACINKRLESSTRFGDLIIEFGDQIHAIYERDLSLPAGVIRTKYHVGGVGRGGDLGFDLTRVVIVSKDGEVIGVRITSDVPGRISFRARLEGEGDTAFVIKEEYLGILRGTMAVSDGGTAPYMAAYLQLSNDGGELILREDALEVRQADAVTLYLSAATSTEDRDADEHGRTVHSGLAAKDFDAL